MRSSLPAERAPIMLAVAATLLLPLAVQHAAAAKRRRGNWPRPWI